MDQAPRSNLVLAADDMDARCRRSWEAFEAESRAVATRADASAHVLEVDLLARLGAAKDPTDTSVTTSFDGRCTSP